MEENNKNNANEEKTVENEEEIEVIDSAENDPAEKETKAQENTSGFEKEMETLKAEKEEVYNRLLRLQAEFDNFKKRSQKEKEADRKYKSQELINELLPAIDNFERALQVETTEENASLVEGITMVYRQLQDALKSQGVEVIETEGKTFDPTLHHAVMQVEDESIDPNSVVEELQKGYMLKDKVIRPAMVKVNK
ncbi:nucleotide exchange factor GrpE [Oceanobacillus massiliensis]|uniref:nucleotide exchange factor GrpE n=1 Tax=Oceanobacillus massiliensis TaxID=1465765 RepID=UPI000289B3D7|nr:nucleotide exchange factor GrpE [Oceanobacillus massiliensis]